MNKVISLVVVLMAIGAGAVIAMQPQEQEEKIESTTTPFMQKKLDHSRDIVSGLAMEDYDLIVKSAQDLMLLSHETDWKVLTTPEYLKMSSDFRGSASRLRDSASDKNMDGSTLAYFEVTLSCVRCHKYIRGETAKNKNQNSK